MDKLVGKVAVVTGASSGIGAATSELLVKNGMKVVGLARRDDRLQEMEKKFSGQGKFYGIKADLRKESDILQAFQWVEKNLGGIQVLINNAGTSGTKLQSETSTQSMKEMYELNIVALQICSREALKSMKIHNINDGNIINISSVVAQLTIPRIGGGTYFASKKAVNAISNALREELRSIKSNTRVTTISPGLCETELIGVVGLKFPQEILDVALQPSNIADAILYVLKLEPHILVSEFVIETTADIRVILQELNKKQ